MPNHPTLRLMLPLLAAAAALPACTPEGSIAWRDSSASFQIPATDHVAWDQIAVDVHNEAGSVIIQVDDRLEQPVVRHRVRWTGLGDDGSWNKYRAPAIVSAQPEPGPLGHATLRVRSQVLDHAPAETEIDLIIRLPRCDGVRVRNTSGPVILVGVGGAITVDNGFGGGEGGRIELRSNRPILDPVALTTTDGRISIIAAEGSRAEVDMHTFEGKAVFSAPRGVITNLRPAIGQWRGTWNDGTNPLLVRTGRGEIRLLVTDDPENYSVADSKAERFDPIRRKLRDG